MFSFLKKRPKPASEKFLDSFNAVCELLLTLSMDEEGNPRPFDPIDMATSAGAVIGAAYVSKKTSVLAGKIDEVEMGPYLDEVNSLFKFVAGASIRQIERTAGRKIDLRSDQAWQLVESLCHAQEEKMSRYIVALAKITMKGPGISVGRDLAIEVQMDVFGVEIPDVIFSMSLLNIASHVA